MNRRDLLKMIGIGGVGAVANVVSGKEVEAAAIVQPVEPSIQDHIDYLNTLYVGDMPSAIVGAPSGTASMRMPERSYFGGRQSWEYTHDTEARPIVTISGPGIDAQLEGYHRVDAFGGDE